jgi:mannitol PTS system EIICBA or EIICB component
MRENMQRFGGFLAGMVIPNMAAFIAWGLITALFIPTGWLPNEGLAKMVGPILTYLLPLLVGYTGGKMVHGVRGGVVGAVATMGVVVGASIPVIMGGMVMGPLGGWLVKKIDEVLEDKIPVGFEMLINNFDAGILAGILAVLGMLVVGPVVQSVSDFAGGIVNSMIAANILPLAALVIEPAKILFLNNAINHGVLGPLGVIAAKDSGQAIHFMLESDPGPGLGLLVAFYVAGKGMLKDSAPTAMIIHFLGGIHEIYFPYVLAHPVMVLAMIAGGMSADLWFNISGAGLVATPSPGSIFAYIAVTPKGGFLPVFTGVLIGAVVSFLVGSFILKVFPVKEEEAEAETVEAPAAGSVVPGLN